MTTMVLCATCGRSATNANHCGCCPQCGGPKSATALRCYTCAWPGRAPRGTIRQLQAEPVVAATVSTSRRRKVIFRVYCFSCSRATEVGVAPLRMDRCAVCGGTLLVEVGDDG